ncbi:DUF2231 domain-containing protein [Bradyrhizobium sp. MOS002]|uniref:DUF2231 domain-containing protein n=1 Tax=Bradyrhizobium sp. MOS002 TaxID=2133947 RepID=UPI0027D29D4A|nr:DUF2231 domain-containing protein [Bradyrhizobium sp. MOS002]
MSASVHAKPIHPLHAVLLAFPFPLFLDALFSDLAYWSTAQVQWANFSSWLIAGGLFAGAFVVLWALTALGSGSRAVLYFLVLLAMWLTGFVNALVRRLAWHSPLRPWEVPSPKERLPVGFKVVFVPFRDGRPAGEPVDFVSGFLNDYGRTPDRPVGVTIDPRGALIVADDLSNTSGELRQVYLTRRSIASRRGSFNSNSLMRTEHLQTLARVLIQIEVRGAYEHENDRTPNRGSAGPNRSRS